MSSVQLEPGADAPQETSSDSEKSRRLDQLVRRLHSQNRIALAILGTVTTLVTLLFISILVYLVVRGFTNLFSPTFYGTSDAGVGPEIFNTFYILILSEIFLFPVSLAAALYLVDYAKPGPLVTAIHFAAETLAGIPSIVLGVVGFALFGSALHMGFSRISGALTLLCLNLPLMLRLFEDALTNVPRDLREGGLALGATKWQMLRTVVLPSAMPGLVTGLILSAGKVIGEAAALIYTMGTFNPSNVFSPSPLIPSDTLTIHLWFIQTAGAGSSSLTASQANGVAAGSATLLVIILLVLNLAARYIGGWIQRRFTSA